MLKDEELIGKFIRYSPEISEEIFYKILERAKGIENTKPYDFEPNTYKSFEENTFFWFKCGKDVKWGDDEYSWGVDNNSQKCTEISYKDIIGEEKPEYVECIKQSSTDWGTNEIGKVYKVEGDTRVDWEISFDGKKLPSVWKERFKSSTKEAYDTQFKEWWKDLKKGDYVVCIDDSYQGCCANKNYIYLNYENGGIWYGNSITSIGMATPRNYNSFRLATPDEIKMYEHAGKPVDVTTYKLPAQESLKVEDSSWCVQVTKENREVIKEYIDDNSYRYSIDAYYGISQDGKKFGNRLPYKFDEIISTEEFYKKIGHVDKIKSNDVKEEEYKVGDWVVITNTGFQISSGLCKGDVVKIASFNEQSGYSWSVQFTNGAKGGYNEHNPMTNYFRKATPEEIAKATDSKEFILPEKWCILKNTEEICKWFTEKIGMIYTLNSRNNEFIHYPAINRTCLYSKIQKDYTEITLDQFNKYVLKEEPIKCGNGILDAVEPKKDNMKKAVYCKNQQEWDFAAKKLGRVSNVAYRKCGDCIKIDAPDNSHMKGKNSNYLDIPFEQWCEEEGIDNPFIEKDNMEEILLEAKKRFPIGCKFYPVHDDGKHSTATYEQTRECYIYNSSNGDWIIGSANIRNAKGDWAKIVSIPKLEVRYNPNEWGWETIPYDIWNISGNTAVKDVSNLWRLPTLTDLPLTPDESFKQNVISPILFDVKKI